MTSLLIGSRPPKRLFGFVDDVAPRQRDIVQVAVGPPRQLATLVATLAPNVKCFAQPGENAGFMMIYHRFTGAAGHLHLQKLVCIQ
jgi:hypothetical protein